MKPRVKGKVVMGTAVAGMAAALLIPASAHAATAQSGRVTVCNSSSSDEYGVFPYRGGFATTIISPGRCWSASGFSGISSDEVVGYRRVNGYWQAVAYRYFNDAAGVTFTF
ncbi:hypothetical protein ABZ845_04335 [Streptomyces sp. NPDC047022]|uniref:hypothetical protein n=1 Tax=Streptomyces sp. NPDC047022 TaxID=3155737 RepID=UPI0033CCA5F1